ncbi:hypothetical protein [Novosphingobium pokkalii]|uniref:Uncharacterized protein n=1 Tax=Novosphingobium pokkalii TaxID=1770194 RepID=A0ABV7V3L9_9SPHN|nr:hypothetical protein [Novosphingobium pokkalii]GHC83334.1 hypothetical protein GCM10019060_02730 [Novosphingobium pokkalii]
MSINIHSTEWQTLAWTHPRWEAPREIPAPVPNGRKLACILALNSALWSAVVVAAWIAAHH